MDIVPLDKFIPLPDGYEKRSIYIGKFENLEVYVFDPYSISLSKVDRGFFTDFDDIVFLVKNGYIDFDKLSEITQTSALQSKKYDLHPDILLHLEELKMRLV